MASLKGVGLAAGLGEAAATMSAGLLAGQRREEAKAAEGVEQGTRDAQILLGAYDKIGDPETFSDMWNTLIQSRGLDWPEMKFNQRTNEGDTFTTRDGRIWLKRPGEPIPIDVTPESARARIEEEEGVSREIREREVSVAERGVGAREEEVENRSRALDIAAQEAQQTGKISGSTLEFLATEVRDYYARQQDPNDTLSTEEIELFEKMKTFLDNYLASQQQAPATGTGLAAGAQAPAGVQAPTRRRTYVRGQGLSDTIVTPPAGSTRQTVRVGPGGRPIQ